MDFKRDVVVAEPGQRMIFRHTDVSAERRAAETDQAPHGVLVAVEQNRLVVRGAQVR